MSTLVDHVAKAIARDEQAGGANILRQEETHALEEASILLRRAGDPHGADLLLNLVHELGSNVMFIDGQGLPRVDEYHRHFATVAIAGYDDWMEIRFRQQRSAHRTLDALSTPPTNTKSEVKPAKPEWIAVKERLPELKSNHEQVRCWISVAGYVRTAAYVYHHGELVFWQDGYIYKPEAWMPLDKPAPFQPTEKGVEA